LYGVEHGRLSAGLYFPGDLESLEHGLGLLWVFRCFDGFDG
jgi:hypothetical protein